MQTAPSFEEKRSAKRLAVYRKHLVENGCFTRTRSARFLEQLLPLEKVEEFPSMESLSAFLKTDVVMQAAGDFFQRVLQLLNWGRRENPLVAGNVHVKIYLGAYMIVCWPYKIFDDIGELEQSMINVSRSLIESFEKMAADLRDGKKWVHSKPADLASVVCKYLRTFKRWKMMDEKKLARQLRLNVQGIEGAMEDARAQGQASSGLLSELEAERKRICAQLDLVEGPGHAPLKAGSSLNVIKKEGVRDARKAEISMTKVRLVHELLIDGNFKVEDDETIAMDPKSLAGTVIRRTFRRAFWNSLVGDLQETPPQLFPLFGVLEEIKTGLSEVACKTLLERRKVNTIINVEKLKNDVQTGSVDLRVCVDIINSLMSIVVFQSERTNEAARKAESIKAWDSWKAFATDSVKGLCGSMAEVVCKGLELVFDRIHKLRVDMTNRKIWNISPCIRMHGVSYASSFYEAEIQAGRVTMNNTEVWIKSTFSKLEAEQSQKYSPLVDLSGLDASCGQPALTQTYRRILNVGFLDLVSYDQGAECIPETLMYDVERLQALKLRFQESVVSAVILTQVGFEVCSKVPSQDSGIREDIMERVSNVIICSLEAQGMTQVDVIDLVVIQMQQGGMKACDCEMARTVIQKHCLTTHPVYMHMVRQFRSAWFQVMDGVPDISLQVPFFAKRVETYTLKHANLLSVVSDVSIKIHAARYNAILNPLVKDHIESVGFSRVEEHSSKKRSIGSDVGSASDGVSKKTKKLDAD